MKKEQPDSIDFFDKPKIPKPNKKIEKEISETENLLKKEFGPNKKRLQYLINQFKKFWQFLKKDSLASLIVTLILAFLIIKFIFFPTLSFITGTPLPLVIVESCSMYHSEGLEQVIQNPIYKEYNITLEQTKTWPLKSGLNKGDIIFVVSAKKLKIGDIIIFEGGQNHPIIHRVISINSDRTITTKGDHNSGFLSVEKNINPDSIKGKAVFKIPFVGWLKLIFYESRRPPEQRGFCKETPVLE